MSEKKPVRAVPKWLCIRVTPSGDRRDLVVVEAHRIAEAANSYRSRFGSLEIGAIEVWPLRAKSEPKTYVEVETITLLETDVLPDPIVGDHES